MADDVLLNPATIPGGARVITEDIDVSGTLKEMPVSKIYTGATNVNGGPVTDLNPFPVSGPVSVTNAVDFRGLEIDAGNSTTAPLAIGETFLGVSRNVLPFVELGINLAGAPVDADGTLYFEFSPDDVNWDVSIPVGGSSLDGPSCTPQVLRVILPFFRVRYVNGSKLQTEFRLTTVLYRVGATRLTRYLSQDIGETDGINDVRAIISATSRFTNAQGNILRGANGGLDVGLVQSEIELQAKACDTGITRQVAVSNSITTRLDSTPLANRKSIEIRALSSNGNARVYVGFSANLTTGQGRELVANEPVTFEVGDGLAVYGIASGSGCTVCVTELGGVA